MFEPFAEEADTLHETLRESIAWRQRYGRVGGQRYREPRLTAWYGKGAYSYSAVRWRACQDWPPALEDLRVRLNAVTGIPINCVMCNLYRGSGDSIGWHADDEPSLGR